MTSSRRMRRHFCLTFLVGVSLQVSLGNAFSSRTAIASFTGTSTPAGGYWKQTCCAAKRDHSPNNNNKDEEVGYLLKEFQFHDGQVLDPYQILKVSRTADRTDIREAYRTQSRLYHPDARLYKDILPGSCNNEQEVREHWERINWSYALLSDPAQRKKYDRHEAWADPAKALRRAAAQAAWNGVASGMKGLWDVGSMAVSRVMSSQNADETTQAANATEGRRSSPGPSVVEFHQHFFHQSLFHEESGSAIPLQSTTNDDIATDSDSADNMESKPFSSKPSPSLRSKFGGFDLSTALFCGGLAFDAYVEPPSNSSRWEKGSQGLHVAFLSAAFTRQLYKGVVEISVEKCTRLPDDDSGAERLLTGEGVDACVLVAAIEGSWEEDVKLLEKEQYHEGVLDLSGAAHVGRTSTAWANVDEKKSLQSKRQRGKASPYHIPGGWGRGGQAIWPEEEPFYLYVQDPATVRLVLTVLDDDRVGSGSPIGSTYKRLSELIPQAALSSEDLIKSMKLELVEAAKKGEIDLLDENTKIRMGAKSWQGALKLTSKPRKKDKNSQIIAGAAAGAYVAGPVGAAAGALLGSFYEGQVQGSIHLKIRYLPIPPASVDRKEYVVKGGLPGVDWGSLYRKYLNKTGSKGSRGLDVRDLELCFFVNHQKTGATCSVYRSLEKKLIVVSFRGTCAPIDLVTDASLVQDAWVEGDDVKNQDIPKVHNGFRTSLNSIARRLKELILATVGPGESIADYDMLVTGHSLGGALATLFTADIGQYGVDGGRGLPQLEESEPWWKGIANFVVGSQEDEPTVEPPRPKSLRLYNFGSPRVGNDAFADLFDALVGEGMIDQAYRIVNGEDVVARMPRTLNGLALGQVRYEHVGTTVLVTQPVTADGDVAPQMESLVWIEGESDDRLCPVRDGVPMASQSGDSSLISELVQATRESWESENASSFTERLSAAMSQLTTRLKTVTAQDVASIVGIDRSFSEREMKLAQALLQGKALAHHMEDQCKYNRLACKEPLFCLSLTVACIICRRLRWYGPCVWILGKCRRGNCRVRKDRVGLIYS